PDRTRSRHHDVHCLDILDEGGGVCGNSCRLHQRDFIISHTILHNVRPFFGQNKEVASYPGCLKAFNLQGRTYIVPPGLAGSACATHPLWPAGNPILDLDLLYLASYRDHRAAVFMTLDNRKWGKWMFTLIGMYVGAADSDFHHSD